MKKTILIITAMIGLAVISGCTADIPEEIPVSETEISETEEALEESPKIFPAD